MSSILTNTGAMTALQTLQATNKSLETTQSQISTGKKVASASDNAAVWAISKTMESDVASFNKIAENLSFGESSVSVAQDAAQTTTDLLQQMKEKIVQAQGASNDDDLSKIQDDIDSLKSQISSTVASAQFNGVNLVNGSKQESLDVLSSINRAADGTVSSSDISVDRNDLRAGGVLEANSADVAEVADSGTIGAALTFQDGTEALAVSDASADADDLTEILAGDVIEVNVGGKTASYTIQEGDTNGDVNTAMSAAVSDAFGTDVTYADGVATNASGGALEMGLTVKRGGLGEVANIDVTTDAAKALNTIEGSIQTAIDASASFGTSQNQISTQSDFVSKLSDNMEAGIGSLVDANMEEASARLQALQTQQQLGIQALSIANQAPQRVLSLFQ